MANAEAVQGWEEVPEPAEAKRWAAQLLAAHEEVRRLAMWIMENTDRPDKAESAVDVAIDLMERRGAAIEMINRIQLSEADGDDPRLGEIMKALGA